MESFPIVEINATHAAEIESGSISTPVYKAVGRYENEAGEVVLPQSMHTYICDLRTTRT